jgi:hypothetical protein
MSLTQEQRDHLEDLLDYRDSIVDALAGIQTILKVNFPEEYEKALQFYLPQITTALHEDKKWLSRGEYSLQNTIDNLLERCKIDESGKGTKKYL